MSQKIHLRKKLDTIEDPQNKHTIGEQGCSLTTTLKNCLGAMFSWGLSKASNILGN